MSSIVDRPKPEIYVISLDVSDKNRWNSVIDDYKDKIVASLEKIEKILGGETALQGMILTLVDYFISTDSAMYIEELKSISERTKLPLNKLVLLQICYEMFAACTSVVFNLNGSNFHFRTMDWEMPFLKDLTIEVSFTRGVDELFRGITWAGYVGIMTAMVPNKYSVALNYRRSNGTLVGNAWRSFNMKWPIGYLIRYTLENGKSFSEAKKLFEEAQLISPCYITLCPTKGDPYVIVRDCDKLVKVKGIDPKYDLLVQTNCDDMNDVNDIMWSKERIKKVHKIMHLKHEWTSFQAILKEFDVKPIMNNHTIYTTIMRPASTKMITHL